MQNKKSAQADATQLCKQAEGALKGIQEKYRLMVENAAEGIVVTQDGILKFVNSPVAHLLGCSKDKLISRPFVDFIHPDDHEMVMEHHIRKVCGKEKPGKYAFRFIDKDKNIRWVENNSVVVTWEGKPATLNFLSDISKRKQAEDGLRESNATIQALIDAIPESAFLVDTKGMVLATNEIAAQRIGKSKEGAIGRSVYDHLPPKVARKRAEKLKQVLDTGKPLRFGDDHSGRHYYNSLYPVFDSDGNVEKVAIFAQDLTMEHQTELALRESQEKYRQLFENESDAVMVLDAETMRFEDANKATLDLYQYSKAEFLDLTVEDISAEKEKTRIAVQKVKDNKSDGNRVPLRYFVKKDGTIFPGEICAGTFISNGRKKIIGAVRDITERLRAEESLKESEQRFRELFNNMSNGVAVYNAVNNGKDFIFIDFNKAGERIENFKREDLIGKSVLDVFPGIKAFGLFDVLQRVWGTGKPEHHPARFYEDGRISGWRENYIYRLPSGEIVAVYENITERVQAEKALRESEFKFRTLFETIPIAIGIGTLDGRILAYNDAAIRMMGYTGEELAEMNLRDLYCNPSDRSCLLQRFKTEGIIRDFEVKLKRKDSSSRDVKLTVSPFHISGEKALLTVFEDITERKRNEQKLKETKNLLSSTFNALQDLVIVIDKDLRVMTSNWKDHDYISVKEREGNPHCYAAIMQRKTPCENCHAMEVFAAGEIKKFEHTNSVDGQTREIQIVPIFDDRKKVVMVVEHLRNITDQKRAEEALRESEKQFRNLFNSIPMGLYRSTPDGQILDVNPAMVEILGYPDKECLLRTKSPETYAIPDDRRRLMSLLRDKGYVRDFSVPLRRCDASVVWVTLHTRLVHDANSQMTYYEGAMQDISDHKEAEKHIYTLSQQLIKTQEIERQMISRELHDGVAQDLSAAKMECDLIYDNLSDSRPPAAQRINRISETLQRSIMAVRNLSYDLRPPGLEELGLVETIFQYCDEFAKRWGVPVDFQSAGFRNIKPDNDLGINLYRLVQEGLTNIRKHAAAGQVYIRLVAAFPNIMLRIEDNGKGFDVQKRLAFAGKEKRMGLRSMEERVKLLNGKMAVRSKPGQGTTISIKLPVG